MARLYGRALRGRRAIGQRPARRGTNTTIVGCVDGKGKLLVDTLRHAIKGLTFVGWLAARIVPLLAPGDVVIMDNLRAHHLPLIRQIIEETGARLIYLPTYSPELNPIEECWSKIKMKIRGMATRTQEMLEVAVQQAAKLVTMRDIAGWFAHSETFLRDSSPERSIVPAVT